jgi:hypothetical protein
MIIDQSSIQSEDGQQLFIVGGGEEEGEESQHHQYQILQVGTPSFYLYGSPFVLAPKTQGWH